MTNMYHATVAVKPVPAVVVLFDSRYSGRLIPRAFGRGVAVVTKAATVEEARDHFLETTISAAEHHARLAAMASADEDDMLAAMARDYDRENPAPLEAGEMDEARMSAPVATESDVCPAPKARKNAAYWASEILDHNRAVASDDQIALAKAIVASPDAYGATIEPVGPSLQELREMRAEVEAKPAPKRRRKVDAAKARRMAVAV